MIRASVHDLGHELDGFVLDTAVERGHVRIRGEGGYEGQGDSPHDPLATGGSGHDLGGDFEVLTSGDRGGLLGLADFLAIGCVVHWTGWTWATTAWAP